MQSTEISQEYVVLVSLWDDVRSDFEVSHGRDVVKIVARGKKIKDFQKFWHGKHGPSLDKNAKLRRNIEWRIQKEEINEDSYNFAYYAIDNRIWELKGEYIWVHL